MKNYVIGIDFGTLSGRAILVDASNGKELATAVMEYPHGVMDTVLRSSGEKLPQNFALQDPNDYILVLKTIVNQVVTISGVDKNDVSALGLDFTSCTVLPIKKDGTPLCNIEKYKNEKHAYVKLWKHHAGQPYADIINKVAKERNEKFLDNYGGVISCECVLPKVYEILDNAPQVYNDADYIVEAGDFINYILTGNLRYSYVFAAYKGFYLDGVGFPKDDFFTQCDARLGGVKDKFCKDIVKLGEPVGTLSSKMAKELNLTEKVIVSSGIIDAHAAGSALGLKQDGDTFGVIGTSACFMSISEKQAVVKGTCGYAKDGIVPNFYGYEAGLCCMGDHFSYLANNVTAPDYVKEADARGISMLNLLMEKAEKLCPGQSGLLALNWWNGNRSILVDSSLSGLFVGMNLNTRPEDYMRALMEATAFGTRNILENYFNYGINVNKFIATGGISKKNACLMQIFADVLKTDIYVAKTKEAGALGSAINASVSAKIYPCFKDAQEKMSTDFDAVYSPIAENSKIYDSLYVEYKKLHDYFGKGENDVMKKLIEIKNKSI